MRAGVAGANAFVARMKGAGGLVATHIEERPRPLPHFVHLVKAIEILVQTGHTPYPAERTMLTTGMHDMLLTSRHQQQQRLATPFLNVRYEPVAYPHAPRPAL
jgi:hypothetical protein